MRSSERLILLIARQLFPSHPPLSDSAPGGSLLPSLSRPPTSSFSPGWKWGGGPEPTESIQTQLDHPRNKGNKALKHPTLNWGARKTDFLNRIFPLLQCSFSSFPRLKIKWVRWAQVAKVEDPPFPFHLYQFSSGQTHSPPILWTPHTLEESAGAKS